MQIAQLRWDLTGVHVFVGEDGGKVCQSSQFGGEWPRHQIVRCAISFQRLAIAHFGGDRARKLICPNDYVLEIGQFPDLCWNRPRYLINGKTEDFQRRTMIGEYSLLMVTTTLKNIFHHLMSYHLTITQ